MKNFRLITAVLFAALASSASAHSPLVSSTPSNNSALTERPTEIQLVFKKSVKLIQLHLISEQMDQKLRPETIADDTSHTVSLPELASGTYAAKWRAMAKDGHVMKGEINFSVAP